MKEVTETIILLLLLIALIIYDIHLIFKTYHAAKKSEIISPVLHYSSAGVLFIILGTICFAYFLSSAYEVVIEKNYNYIMLLARLFISLIIAVNGIFKNTVYITKEGAYFPNDSRPKPYSAEINGDEIRFYTNRQKDTQPFYVTLNSEKNRKRFAGFLHEVNGEIIA